LLLGLLLVLVLVLLFAFGSVLAKY